MAENAEQLPRYGSLKGTGGQQGGELVLFLKQESRLQDLDEKTQELQREYGKLKELEKEEARGVTGSGLDMRQSD